MDYGRINAVTAVMSGEFNKFIDQTVRTSLELLVKSAENGQGTGVVLSQNAVDSLVEAVNSHSFNALLYAGDLLKASKPASFHNDYDQIGVLSDDERKVFYAQSVEARLDRYRDEKSINSKADTSDQYSQISI